MANVWWRWERLVSGVWLPINKLRFDSVLAAHRWRDNDPGLRMDPGLMLAAVATGTQAKEG